jgi:hypothetical protein
MSTPVPWSEQAAARLRRWAQQYTPAFLAHVRKWAIQNVPMGERTCAVNDIVATELLQAGYVELCPCCGQFKTPGRPCHEGIAPWLSQSVDPAMDATLDRTADAMLAWAETMHPHLVTEYRATLRGAPEREFRRKFLVAMAVAGFTHTCQDCGLIYWERACPHCAGTCSCVRYN